MATMVGWVQSCKHHWHPTRLQNRHVPRLLLHPACPDYIGQWRIDLLAFEAEVLNVMSLGGKWEIPALGLVEDQM